MQYLRLAYQAVQSIGHRKQPDHPIQYIDDELAQKLQKSTIICIVLRKTIKNNLTVNLQPDLVVFSQVDNEIVWSRLSYSSDGILYKINTRDRDVKEICQQYILAPASENIPVGSIDQMNSDFSKHQYSLFSHNANTYVDLFLKQFAKDPIQTIQMEDIYPTDDFKQLSKITSDFLTEVKQSKSISKNDLASLIQETSIFLKNSLRPQKAPIANLFTNTNSNTVVLFVLCENIMKKWFNVIGAKHADLLILTHDMQIINCTYNQKGFQILKLESHEHRVQEMTNAYFFLPQSLTTMEQIQQISESFHKKSSYNLVSHNCYHYAHNILSQKAANYSDEGLTLLRSNVFEVSDANKKRKELLNQLKVAVQHYNQTQDSAMVQSVLKQITEQMDIKTTVLNAIPNMIQLLQKQ